MYNGSRVSLRAVDTAAHFAVAEHALLTIAVTADSAARAKEIQYKAAAWLRENGFEARFRWILPPESKKLKAILASEGRCMLILPDNSFVLKESNINEILQDLDCPVLLVS